MASSSWLTLDFGRRGHHSPQANCPVFLFKPESAARHKQDAVHFFVFMEAIWV